MTDQPIGIGTRLWRFDPERRVYANVSGAQYSPPIFAAKFEPYRVIDETPKTWVVIGEKDTDGKYPYAVNKRSMRQVTRRGEAGLAHYVDAQRDDMIWVRENGFRVCDAVKRCSDASILRQIATLFKIETTEPDDGA